MKKICRLSGNEITSKGASLLFHRLMESNIGIQSILLSSNRLDDDCMKDIGEYIQSNLKIQCININNNRITDKGIEIITPYINSSSSLMKLSLSFNSGITDASFTSFTNMITASKIEHIHFKSTSIEQGGLLWIYLAFNQVMNGSDKIELSARLVCLS